MSSFNLLSAKPNTIPRFVNVASLAPAARTPESIRLPISDDRFRKPHDMVIQQQSRRTEATSVAGRLERVAESVVESEKQKLQAKLKGKTLSEEEMVAVETMCEEIVSKFMEAPMEYLKSGDCCRQKITDLELFLHILESAKP